MLGAAVGRGKAAGPERKLPEILSCRWQESSECVIATGMPNAPCLSSLTRYIFCCLAGAAQTLLTAIMSLSGPPAPEAWRRGSFSRFTVPRSDVREPLLPDGRRPPAPGALPLPPASPRLLGDCATASARFMGLRLACMEGVSSGVAEPRLLPRPLPGIVVQRTRYVCRSAMYSCQTGNGTGRMRRLGAGRSMTQLCCGKVPTGPQVAAGAALDRATQYGASAMNRAPCSTPQSATMSRTRLCRQTQSGPCRTSATRGAIQVGARHNCVDLAYSLQAT